MRAAVLRERRAVTEAPRAERTLIWPLAGVGSYVYVERTALRETLVADDATVWLLSAVRTEVDGEAVGLEEALVADVAHVRLLLVVHALLVTAQRRLRRQITPTLITAESACDPLRRFRFHSGTGIGHPHPLPTVLVADVLKKLVEW